MLYSGADLESHITECTLVYEGRVPPGRRARPAGRACERECVCVREREREGGREREKEAYTCIYIDR